LLPGPHERGNKYFDARRPYDRHTLAAQIEPPTVLLQDIGVKPRTAIVDLGCRRVDHEVPVDVIRVRTRNTPVQDAAGEDQR
jgi:hypothetical protein